MPRKKAKKKSKKKSNLHRRIDIPYSKYWLNKADEAWKELIQGQIVCAIAMFEYREPSPWMFCQGKCEAHHLFDKDKFPRLRHDRRNGILLCAKHHKMDNRLSAHRGSLLFAKWMSVYRPQQWEWATTAANIAPLNGERIDYRASYEKLQELLNGAES